MRKIQLLIALLFIVKMAICQSNFIKHPTNPVLSRTPVFGAWDAIAVSDPHVLEYNDTLRMWYTGVGWLSALDTTVHQRIGYAWSLDGINWTQYTNNPVLDKSDGYWDDLGVETSTIIVDTGAIANERYKMWYAGQNSISGVYDIGYAYSPDGINWTKSSSNPILQTGINTSWENAYLEGPSVLFHNDTLRMWYASVDLTGDGSLSDFTGNIGYAWSLDGINWNKHPSNPIFTSYDSPNWDQASVADPHVIRKGGQYHMFYAGLNSWANENFKMGYAISNDGINWTRPVSSPVLETGSFGEWDDEDASYGCVIYNSTINQYQMWYTGIDTSSLPPNISAYFYEIGYATSNAPLSIKETIHSAERLELFPNPCSNNLIIKLDNNSGSYKLILFNSIGRIVNVPISKDKTQIILQTESLVSGVYYIELIISENREIYHGVFIKE